MLFHRDKNILVVATKQDTAKNMVRMVKVIYRHLPKWMMAMGQGYDADNRLGVELKNGSRIKAKATASDVRRTEALSFLVIDEVAHIKGFDDIWTGLWPTISTGGSVALLSTPNGTGNVFHKEWEKANSGESIFNCRFGTYVNPANPEEVYDDRLMWWVHPEHDEAWFAAETAGKSPREVAQEYLCNFNASGDTFIWHEDIARFEKEIKSEGRQPDYFALNRDVWIWEKPQKEGVYLISVDISRGDAKDFSAFHVTRLDVSPLEQVAEYKGKVRPDALGVLLVAVSRVYNNAIIAPENNSGWSGQTVMKIQEANYPFLYYSRKRKPKIKNHTMADPLYAETRNDYLPGYTVTSANRTEMLSKMEQYLRLGEYKVNSPRLIAEFKTFIVNDSGKPEAQRGYNDDLIMALAGGLWVRDEAFLYSHRTSDMATALLESMSISQTTTRQFKDLGYNNGNPYDRGRIKEYQQQQNKIFLGNGDVEDLSWLISSG
jgi:hypothetical protein